MAKQVLGDPGVVQYNDYLLHHRNHNHPNKRMADTAGMDLQDGQSSDEECLDMRNHEQIQARGDRGDRQPQPKKTKGRVKIKMEFIDNKLRRYTTFSKRKTGIMKKAYELSTLTGTQVMLLVASETGHVYTFATRKLQPMITSEAGKALIQTCLNSPDPPPEPATGDQRMSATGYEETELNYNIAEDEEGREDNEREEENEEYEEDTREGSVDTRDESAEPEDRKPSHPIFTAPGLSVFPSHHPPSSHHGHHPPTSLSIHPSSHPVLPPSSHSPYTSTSHPTHDSTSVLSAPAAHKASVSTTWKLQEAERRFGVNVEKRDSVVISREPVSIAPKLKLCPQPPDKNGGMYVETRDGLVFAPSLASLPPHILAHLAAANGDKPHHILSQLGDKPPHILAQLAAANGAFKSLGAVRDKPPAGSTVKTEEAKGPREETR